MGRIVANDRLNRVELRINERDTLKAWFHTLPRVSEFLRIPLFRHSGVNASALQAEVGRQPDFSGAECELFGDRLL